MSQAKAKIIQFRVTEQDYANLMPISLRYKGKERLRIRLWCTRIL